MIEVNTMILKKKCKFCGELFEPKREWQKFCSKDHQQAYWKKIYDERYKLSKRVEKLEEKMGK